MKKTLEITEMHDNEGVEDGNDKVTELPTNSFLYREQEQKKKLVELKQKDTEQTQNIIRKLSTRFKRNSWLAIGGAIDPGTGNLQTPPDGIWKNFKRQFKKKVNKCIPQNIPIKKIRLSLTNFVIDNAELMNVEANKMLGNFFLNSFQCKR